MLKQITAMMLLGIIILTSCAQNKNKTQEMEKNNAIVCYFSASGTTRAAAERLASITGADLLEIVPETPYSAADLDWTDSLSRSSKEMKDPAARPAIKDLGKDLSGYSVVYIGYPNWWNTHPRIINTFLESADLRGKTIAPFMTSGGSDITGSEADLKRQYPALNFAPGLLMNSVTAEEINEWTSSLSR